MKTIYIVVRDSADGQELDCFDCPMMAQQWADAIGETVQEENIIDRETMGAMLATKETA